MYRKKIEKHIFLFQDARVFHDSLTWLEDTLVLSQSEKIGIRFVFDSPLSSLRQLKKILLAWKDIYNWDNLYFFHASDFVNMVLDREVYLPKNINLFINESCFIGCNFCENPNDIKTYLWLKDIQIFLDKYPLGDDMNFNVLGQGDPLFNPELFDILYYLESIEAHITFFSWGKSLLYTDRVEELYNLVDEFKINLSCSNYEMYNATHRTPIAEKDFPILLERLKLIAPKSIFICVLVPENVGGILEFYKLVEDMWCRGVEYKKNLQYLDNDILDNPVILQKVLQVLTTLYNNSKMDFISNIGTGMIRVGAQNFFQKSSSILERQVQIDEKTLDEINDLWVCHQFGNSLDITENKRTSLCCHYDVWDVSHLHFSGKYYDNSIYKEKKEIYKKQTPESCKKCPMPVDRYRNFLKYNFVIDL